MIRKPTWESIPTIPAPPPDEIDVDVDADMRASSHSIPGSPDVHIVREVAGLQVVTDALLRQLLDEIAGMRKDISHVASEVTSIKSTQERTGGQVRRLCDFQQIQLNNSDRNNGMAGLIILIVEDEPDVLGSTKRMLERAGATVHSARSALEAIDVIGRLSETGLDSALIDLRLGADDIGGIQVAVHLRQYHRECRRVAITGGTDESLPRGLFHAVASKPIEIGDLRRLIWPDLAAE
jgi:CheY-like chemotaxis protein